MNLKVGQRQTLADFYSNFALAWITFGLISPIFVGVANIKTFVIKLAIAAVAMFYFLSIALKYQK